MSKNTIRGRRLWLGGAAAAAAAALAVGGASLAGAAEGPAASGSAGVSASASAGDASAAVAVSSQRRVKVGALVITMFDPEHESWTKREKLPITVDVPGAYAPVRCNADGLCVMETGEGKTNAGTSVTAVLDSPRLDFSHAYFLTAGIAGTPPTQGTLGFAAWARWVVDYDLGHHVDPTEAPDVPHGFLPAEDYNTAAYHLNEKLVDTAYRLTRNLKLEDSAAAVATRAHYPGQAGRTPNVAECDTMSGDDFFSGKVPSATASYIMQLRTKGQGTYCTTQMEDNATAEALRRHGYLDRYLSLRTASNFDQPYPGQSVTEHLNADSGGFQPSLDNAYLVGSTVADYLVKHPYQGS